MTKANWFDKSLLENRLDYFDKQVKEQVVIYSHFNKEVKDQLELRVTWYVEIDVYNVQEHTDSC